LRHQEVDRPEFLRDAAECLRDRDRGTDVHREPEDALEVGRRAGPGGDACTLVAQCLGDAPADALRRPGDKCDPALDAVEFH
jgi:hypothetical protein